MAKKQPFYHAWLSFRGPDTRDSFACIMQDELERVKLKTFMFDDDIKREIKITEVEELIRNSMCVIVIFSENYAYSNFCLDELTLILEQKRSNPDYIIIPIYYHGVTPSDVSHQSGPFGYAFEQHEKRHGDKVDGWRAALAEIANYSPEIVSGKITYFVKGVANNLKTRIDLLVAQKSCSLLSESSISSSSENKSSQFSFEEIIKATNNFASSKILGQGGEAKVYLAEIYIGSNRTLVALKRFKDNSKEIEREIHTLSKIQHSNIVSLLGYCSEFGNRILVYEYMENGCLSDYVKKHSRKYLSWMQRLNICLGVARGLQHLHTETDEFPKGIIHRDVKPGNILMGENWVGKLSDFGILKLSSADQDISLMTTNLKGTSGYFAPEYIKHGRITRKIDVYAFGVVLFQVLCRKMPWDREDESFYAHIDEDLGLWAQQNVDAQIQEEMSGDSLKVFTDIIRRSLQADPGERPTMDDVVLDILKALEFQNSENLAKKC